MSIVRFILISITSFYFFTHTLGAQSSDNRIRVVGSTAVYPFAASVAEVFGKFTDYKTPIVEATGTGGGFRIFCQGSSRDYPDAVVASRPIQKSEKDKCTIMGISDVEEFLIGHDGLVLARNLGEKSFSLSLEQLFMALASHVYIKGVWIANPFKKWSDISVDFPNMPIKVLGPPPSSGTHAVIMDLVIRTVAKKYKGGSDVKDIYIREDGHYIEASTNENVIAQKLRLDPDANGIFSYSFLLYNKDVLQGIPIEGVEPALQTISNKSYPLSRPLYIYVKGENLKKVAGFHEFLNTFFDVEISGRNGYLVRKGLIYLNDNERDRQLQILKKYNPNNQK